jgi:hypothetical protein
MEITIPNNPMMPKPMMTNPKGKWGEVSTGETGKVGMTSGAGGVNVGKRVSVGLRLKVAMMAGSIVETTMGVNVGGGSVIGGEPVKVTYGA